MNSGSTIYGNGTSQWISPVPVEDDPPSQRDVLDGVIDALLERLERQAPFGAAEEIQELARGLETLAITRRNLDA